MSFFTPVQNSRPYLKAAFNGFAGSGKTHTAALLAIGMHQHIGSDKPVAMFDTERASKFLRPMFEEAGIELVVKESRSMADLKQAMTLCREGASDILLVDSLSHLWEDYLAAYMRKKGRNRLEFQDWGVIKPTWKREFSDPLVRDPYHMIICGRAGYEYSNEVDDRGKRQVYKSGVKMKVEGETAYEPDLLVLMERFENIMGEAADKEVWREATILKDRSTLIDGKTFRNPTFEDFRPFVESILAGATDAKPAKEIDAGTLFPDDDKTGYEMREAAKVELDEIQSDLTAVWPGRTKEEQKHKSSALSAAYGTTSWKRVEKMDLGQLREHRHKMAAYIVSNAEDLEPTLADRLQGMVDGVAKANAAAKEPDWMSGEGGE